MGRICTVCSHEDRYEIDSVLVDRSASYRNIAERFALSSTAVSRHVTGGHISELIALAADAERSARADTLLDRIEDLQARTLAILETSEETREHGTALSAVREARRNLELIGEVTRELDRTPILNIHLNAEWIELRTAILRALEPHPEARESFLMALTSVSNGSTG
jgi:hypothetical protein